MKQQQDKFTPTLMVTPDKPMRQNEKRWNTIKQGEIKRDRWHCIRRTLWWDRLFSLLEEPHGVSKKPWDRYLQTASCPSNHSRCDNWIICLLWSFHLIKLKKIKNTHTSFSPGHDSTPVNCHYFPGTHLQPSSDHISSVQQEEKERSHGVNCLSWYIGWAPALKTDACNVCHGS